MRRLSTRLPVSGLLIAAILVGLLTGLLGALLDDAPGRSEAAPQPPATVALQTGPLRTSPPDIRPPGRRDVLPAVYPDRSGRDARIVARAQDPYGGPVWAVRTFTVEADRNRNGRRSQTCAQVGRVIDGTFVWIDPHRERALRVPVTTTATTVCTGRSRPAVIGALRLPAPADPGANPQISATVLWGLSPQPRTRVALRSPASALDLPARARGVRLRIVRGDLDVGRRTVVADDAPVVAGIDNAEYGIPSLADERRRGRPIYQYAATAGLHVAAIVTNPSSERPALLATSTPPRGTPPCYAIVDRLVGGEPVRPIDAVGALAPAQALCMTVPDVPPGRWVPLNGGASSNGSDRTAERRRLRELRTLAGSSTQTLAFPRNVAEVDLQDPLGVRTVRTVPLGRASIVHVQRAGDLAVGGLSFFDGNDRRVFSGRRADGTTVVLRPWRPR